MTKRAAILLLSLFVVLLGYLLYRNLGGGQPIEYTEESGTFIILGEPYEGDYNSNRLEEIFVKARAQTEILGGKLAVVNYGSDTEARQISQFIGVLVEDSTMQSKESDYHIRKFQSQYFIKATINAHNFVMPKPAEVREGAMVFNSKRAEKLSEISIEVYESERELRVYFLVK